ncbi:hypothetical protein ASPWEDRAFT_612366 [Aspergillus wentii DTO 134E9]|uniref:Uncharacterized protein n=1 Tax=Aspergillus wentii DTO 134E9 TaxID=1073089 RepID=A0A1L9RE49_ASPWE|nr:uncharacterized protein ASPWEDRAFT_612366 [Aspergillus wentii DTO 134E9]OJJ33184.1 hypothetical protein ASPWEDRAFT_612366 [Aspergillus wentii DTO 134E9]
MNLDHDPCLFLVFGYCCCISVRWSLETSSAWFLDCPDTSHLAWMFVFRIGWNFAFSNFGQHVNLVSFLDTITSVYMKSFMSAYLVPPTR